LRQQGSQSGGATGVGFALADNAFEVFVEVEVTFIAGVDGFVVFFGFIGLVWCGGSGFYC
jgi:hypothetical protein